MNDEKLCFYTCQRIDDLMTLCAELYGAATGAARPDVREQIENQFLPRLRETGVFS